MKAGNGKVVARVEVPEVTVALTKFGLPQADFENLLGVLVPTL
jgi:hypothetical protein